MRTVKATRYVTPLREGGSLPAIIEGDDSGLYVLKFRGAGQGRKVLVAEQICGELGRALGLNVPEIVLVQLDAALGRNEPDSEIRELLKASVGLNLALDYLPGSLTYDPLAPLAVDALTASRIVWFDALLLNVDRTAKNPNLLTWHERLWLIDHGAALYFHHAWPDAQARAKSPFAQVKDHVLLPLASELRQVDAELRATLSSEAGSELVGRIVRDLPDAWLEGEPGFASADAVREAYRTWFSERLSSTAFLEEAVRARAERV